MILATDLLDSLQKNGFSFFAGVPDSLMKNFCSKLTELNKEQHIVSANEGAAIALAAGYHLATKNAAVVYLQNSGLGNCINPLLSLADPMVYGVPMLLIIGWRGEPGVKDEPQHVKQGMVTEEILVACGLPYEIMPQERAAVESCIKRLRALCIQESRPVGLLVKEGSFSKNNDKEPLKPKALVREQAIRTIAEFAPENAFVVSTTGHVSRELYEFRKSMNLEVYPDFLTVGSMGHCSQIALGAAMNSGKVGICLDGDGAVLMHLGSMATIAQIAPKGFLHVILNNSVHGSVGGQPTTAPRVSFAKVAQALGYPLAIESGSIDQIKDLVANFHKGSELTLLEVKVGADARSDLARPVESPKDNKIKFQKFLRDGI